jgi:hypothetical protein
VGEFKRPFESELRFHIAPRTYQGRSTRSLGSCFERLWSMHKGALRVLSVRQPFPLCPRFQTYFFLAANDVQGQQASRLRGLEIDNKLESCWSLNRQIPRFGALQNAVDVRRRSALQIRRVYPIGNETTGSGKQCNRIDRRNPVLGRPRNDQVAYRLRRCENIG